MRGELPKGWQQVSLGDIGALYCGQSPPSSTVNAERRGVPYVTGPEQWDGHSIDQIKWTTEPKRVVPDNCIFVTVKGAGVGTTFPGIACAIGRDVYAFQPSSRASYEFVHLALKNTIQDVLLNARGDIPGLSRSHIVDHVIGLPPLNEQRRIVAKIEELTRRTARAKEALDAIPSLLERYRQSVLAAAFRGDLTADWRAQNLEVESVQTFLRQSRLLALRDNAGPRGGGRDTRSSLFPRDAETAADLEVQAARRPLPSAWIWAATGEVFGVYVGATPSRKEASYWSGDIPWVSSGEVAFRRISSTRESITETGLRNTSTRVHPPGTVLLGMIGEGKTRGQAAILNIAACTNQNCAAIRVSETPYPPEYLYWYLVAEYERTRSLGGGSNQPALNKQRVQRLPFPLAPMEEARVIAASIEKALGPMITLAAQVVRALRQRDELDGSILAKAFRGELVPQDPNDEPASVLLARIKAERAAAGTPARRGRRRAS